LYLRTAHQVPAQVDDVNTDVDQRTAAGTFNVGEPAARVTNAADARSFCVINLAEFTIVDELFYDARIGSISEYETDLQRFAAFANGFFDGQSLFYRFAQRLLAQHVLAGFKRCNADRCMAV